MASGGPADGEGGPGAVQALLCLQGAQPGWQTEQNDRSRLLPLPDPALPAPHRRQQGTDADGDVKEQGADDDGGERQNLGRQQQGKPGSGGGGGSDEEDEEDAAARRKALAKRRQPRRPMGM